MSMNNGLSTHKLQKWLFDHTSIECCKTCHFLAKGFIGRGGKVEYFHWTEEELSEGSPTEDFLVKRCYQGVWDVGRAPPDPKILSEDRRGTCFYFKRREGMPFEGAINLQDQKAIKQKSKREKYTLTIAVIALVISIIHIMIALVI